MNRLMRLKDAALIFRAMIGDKKAEEMVSIQEVQGYLPSDTFEGFLAVNQIQYFEEVVR